MNKKFFNYLGNSSGGLIQITANNRYQIRQANTVFATARNAISGFYGSADNGITCAIVDPNYFIMRQFVLFDLSAVVGTIVSAYILVPNNNVDVVTAVSLQKCTNIGSLTTADYDSFEATLLGSNTENITTPYTGHKITFNNDGIIQLNLKGIQRFVFRDYTYDYLNVIPIVNTSATTDASGFSTIYLTIQ